MKYKASVTIEAAIVVPIVFYTMMVLYSLMSYLYLDYRLSRAAAEAAVDFSYDSYLLYHLELSELLAHHSYQRQSLKAEDILKLEKKAGELTQKPIDFHAPAAGELIGDFREIAKMSGDMAEKISKLPEELPGIGKSEATVYVSRLFFDHYLKQKISRQLAGVSGFQAERLSIDFGRYLYDFKASSFYVRYLYTFPLPLPFLKQAEIRQPIYVESYIGNIRRYDGEKYQKKEDEQEEPEEPMVYITEKAGARYHTNRYCTVIYSPVYEFMKKKLPDCRACQICEKKGWIFSDIVYKTDSSAIYHAKKECSRVNHQVTEIPLSEAEERGLTQCRHCQKKEAGK